MKKISDKVWNGIDRILELHIATVKVAKSLDPDNKKFTEMISRAENLRASVSINNLPGDDTCKWNDLGGGCFTTACGAKMDICDKMIYCGNCGNKIVEGQG